jgi:Zn-dependent protease/predicted transcriptional regulator
MHSSFSIGRVAGIRIGIHYTWLIAFLLIAWSLAASYYPDQVRGLDASAYWLIAIISTLLLFASVLAHELAHSLVARRLGLNVDSITLFIFGGVSNLTSEPSTARNEFLVAVVGPVSSLVLAALFWLLGQTIPARTPVGSVAGYLAFVNLLLGGFNLVPGFPLDGGRVLRSLIWGATGSLRRATLVASYVGQAFGWLLIVWGLTRVLGGDLLGGLWTGFIGWFLNGAAESTRQEQTVQQSVRGISAAELMQEPAVAVPPNLSVEDFVFEQVMRHGHRALPVVDNGRLMGLVSLSDARKLPRDAWPTTPVAQIMSPSPLVTVAPSEHLGVAIARMAQHGIHQLPVVADARLLGLLTRADVLRYLQLRHELGMDDESDATSAKGLHAPRSY